VKADATPLPERALTTADIASQFAAKAKVQAVASDVDERGEFAELASSGRRGSRHDDPHEEQRHLVEFMTLSDAQRGAQFAELAERVAELERQRLALLAEVAAAIESMTLAGAPTGCTAPIPRPSTAPWRICSAVSCACWRRTSKQPPRPEGDH
jgi:hypothetical protein